MGQTAQYVHLELKGPETFEQSQGGRVVSRITVELLVPGTMRLDFGFMPGLVVESPHRMPRGGGMMLCFKGDSDKVENAPSPSSALIVTENL